MARRITTKYTWDTSKREFASYLYEKRRGSAVIRLAQSLALLNLFEHKERIEIIPDVKNHALLIVKKT